MGHALVAMAIPGTDPVHKISIIPRGIGALGYTMQHPAEDRFLMSRQELEDRMCVLLGGRAAEMLLGDNVSTGAADDLTKATDIARGIVLRYGRDSRLGPVAWDTDPGSQFLQQQPGAFWRQRRFSEETAHDIDVAVRARMEGALKRAVAILRENRAVLDQGAAALLAHETLTGDQIPRPVPVGRLRRSSARSGGRSALGRIRSSRNELPQKCVLRNCTTRVGCWSRRPNHRRRCRPCRRPSRS